MSHGSHIAQVHLPRNGDQKQDTKQKSSHNYFSAKAQMSQLNTVCWKILHAVCATYTDISITISILSSEVHTICAVKELFNFSETGIY